jgi:hypothetical protein
MKRKYLTASWLALGILGAVLHGDVRTSKRDAELLREKVAAITAHGERAAKEPRKTILTESEVNSYLVFDAKDQLPAGVVEPWVSALGPGRVSGRAIVDLDAVRKAKSPTGLLDPMNYLFGRLPVTAVGTLKTANGVGRFELESASAGSIPIPKMLLQEIISHYSRTREKPAGLSLDDPFELPSRIKEIQVERGQAIILQ